MNENREGSVWPGIAISPFFREAGFTITLTGFASVIEASNVKVPLALPKLIVGSFFKTIVPLLSAVPRIVPPSMVNVLPVATVTFPFTVP
jgi:hypothetical protein